MSPEMFFRKARLKERLQEECNWFIEPIWERYQKEILGLKRIYRIDKYSIRRDYVDIEYWVYDSPDDASIPIEFFIDFDKALENRNKKIEEERLEYLRRESEKEKSQQEAFEKFERQQYEMLKKKYEGE